MGRVLVFVLLLALVSKSVSYVSPVFNDTSPYSGYDKVEIKDGQVIRTGSDFDRYINWAAMVVEANKIYHFKNGVVYSKFCDTADKEEIRRKTYYMANLVTDAEEFVNITGPDWTSWSYDLAGIDNFDVGVYEIVEAGNTVPRSQKLAWVGGITNALPGRREYLTRPMLLEYTANYSSYFNFRHTGVEKFARTYRMWDLIRDNAYVLDIGGNGYSGRLKYLLYSKRPLFMVERLYVEYWHQLLKPYVHYIPVKWDLTDLVSQYEWAVKHPKECEEIAQNAQDLAFENLNTDKFIERVGQVMTYLLEDGH